MVSGTVPAGVALSAGVTEVAGTAIVTVSTAVEIDAGGVVTGAPLGAVVGLEAVSLSTSMLVVGLCVCC